MVNVTLEQLWKILVLPEYIFTIYIYSRMYLYFSGLPEGQNFNNLRKQVYGPSERELNIFMWLRLPMKSPKILLKLID